MSEITIILVEPSHPGNIGGVARAMKNMGLSALTLVSPLRFPDMEATIRASGADDLLEKARIVPTLSAAITESHVVFGTSARDRRVAQPVLSPRETADKISLEEGKNCAIVFGRESSGLTNEELALCHYHVHIPTVSDFSSLNLAAAVQVIAYELFISSGVFSERAIPEDVESPATAGELNGFIENLRNIMIDVEFLNPKQPKKLMQRLQRLFHRAELSTTEIHILRGFLSAVAKKMK